MTNQLWPIAVLVLLTSAGADETRNVKGQPPPTVRERVRALERLMESRNEESLSRFLAEQISPAARESRSREEWPADLQAIRARCTGFGTLLVARSDDGLLVVTFGETPTGDVRSRWSSKPSLPA